MTPNWDFPKNGYPKLRPMFWSSGILFQKSWKFGSLKVLKKKKKKKKKSDLETTNIAKLAENSTEWLNSNSWKTYVVKTEKKNQKQKKNLRCYLKWRINSGFYLRFFQ
jgi:hypothetical protein